MASISHSQVGFVGTSASDLLRSSSNGVNGIPLRTLGRVRFGGSSATTTKRRDSRVVAKIRKVKKHDHPWPDNPDPNVKGGILTHLSHFKPLPENEKPRPITLEFEKPLINLEKKIVDVNLFSFFFFCVVVVVSSLSWNFFYFFLTRAFLYLSAGAEDGE